jgi:uncharacterized protein (UPF0335 family)
MVSEGVSSDALLEYIERVERLETEKREIQDAIKEVYNSASGCGFEPKIIKQLVRLRKMDEEQFKENETLLAIYKKALGMLIEVYTTKSAVQGAAYEAAG